MNRCMCDIFEGTASIPKPIALNAVIKINQSYSLRTVSRARVSLPSQLNTIAAWVGWSGKMFVFFFVFLINIYQRCHLIRRYSYAKLIFIFAFVYTKLQIYFGSFNRFFFCEKYRNLHFWCLIWTWQMIHSDAKHLFFVQLN